MYVVNKIVWFFLNPITFTLIVAAAGLVVARSRLRVGLWTTGIALAALYLQSTYVCALALGWPLERPYAEMQDAATSPSAEAIVLLGGGMAYVDAMTYPDMTDGADRVWHAARLYKAGKAPKVVVAGIKDLETTVPLLLDFGVPEEAIVVDNDSRNTYENSRNVAQIAGEGGRVLLVTSAWHMGRALGNFRAAGLDPVPAPCDFKAYRPNFDDLYFWDWFAPNASNLQNVQTFAKEWLGRFARR